MEMKIESKNVEAKNISGAEQKRYPENEKEPLIITADRFVAVQFGTPLAFLVKGTVPHMEDCPPGGDCACDCGGGNCACECHECD